MPDAQPRKNNQGRPTLCRSCGAIVGAGESRCAVCEAPVAVAQPARRVAPVDRETLRFARTIFARPYKFTIVFLIANFFVFLLMWQSSGMTTSALQQFPPEVLIAYGAKINYYIREFNHWWRFVTPMFIHVNLIHLLVNMYSLWMVGPYVEKLYGSAKFVVFWVVTGVVGVVASYLTVIPGSDIPGGMLGRFLFRIDDNPSAGASGALFGLVGVLFVFGIKFRHELPEGFKRAFGMGMLPIILINLFIGYVGRGIIDNAAHLGGLVSGAAMATVVSYRRPGERMGVAITWRVLQAAALILLVVSFFEVAQTFNKPVVWPIPGSRLYQLERNQKFHQYLSIFTSSQEALQSFVLKDDATKLAAATKQLDALPPLDPKPEALRNSLRSLLVKAADLKTQEAQQQPAELLVRKNEVVKEFTVWGTNYEEWLTNEAKNYSLVIEQAQPNQ